MTAITAINQYIGKHATLSFDGLEINVKVTDAKNSYGVNRVQIEPISGSGSKWVNLSSVKFGK